MPLHGESELSAWAEQATEALAPHGLGPVHWVDETGSTNADLLEAAAAGAPPGCIEVAEHQTAGRGRRGRTWTTAPGDALLTSVLLRPTLSPDRYALLTAALSVAAAEACADLGCPGVEIKWPNDLVVGEPARQRKLAGILAQSHTVGVDTVVVVGLGLNVGGGRLREQLDDAVALEDLGCSPTRPDLLVAVFTRFASWLGVAEAADVAPLQARYRDLSATIGRHVRCDLGEEVLLGTAVDVDADGALLVEADGGVRRVLTGDVVSLRSADS